MKVYTYKDFVEDSGDALVVLDSIAIKEGDYIQIHLPLYDKKFYFVEQRKVLLNATNIARAVASVVSTGAIAVGLGSGTFSTFSKAMNIWQRSTAVQYGANAINQVDKHPIF